MPLFNHEGGSEASYDKGEKYKERVEEYLRARGFTIERRSNHHGTTEDLAAIGVDDDYHFFNGEKASDEFKTFVRIEAKGGDLSRLSNSFLTELARVFIDYCEQDGGFEYHIYAANLQAMNKWEKIFSPRKNTDEAINEYFQTIIEDSNLTEAEQNTFDQYDRDDFEGFLTDVFIHQATWDRLGQMAEDERSIDRSKFDFYTRENSPLQKPETLIPNFLRIEEPPEYITTAESTVGRPEEIYDHNEVYRHMPIWIENGTLYTLFTKDELSDPLRTFINEDSITQSKFVQWLDSDENTRRISKKLFERYIKRRAITDYEDCRMVRHNRENRVIFEHIPEENDTDEPTQTKVETWVVTMERGRYIAHRYGIPKIKQYEETFYVFVETGWLFSSSGRGTNIVEGSRASNLHDDLQGDGYNRPNNLKAQFRQWRSYFDLVDSSSQAETLPGMNQDDDPQKMSFVMEDLEIRKQPPKSSDEQEHLMDKDVTSYQ